MRNMHLRILKLVILFGLICLLVLPGRVAADSVIKSIDIIQVDSTHFPDISFTVDLLDSTRTPVTQLSAESLIVKENDIQMPYTFVSTQRGVNVVVVLDISDTVLANGRSGKPILDEMRTAALAFVDTMQPVDAVEVLAVTGNKPEVVQAFTNDAGVLKPKLTN